MTALTRKTLVAFVAVAAAFAMTLTAYGDGKAAEKVTLKGEILDLHCYMLHPDTGHGPDHAKCANSCISRGLPSGLLVDGSIYVLLGPGHGSPSELIEGHAGRPVSVTGTVVEHHGMKAFQIDSVDGGNAQTKPAGHGHGHDHGEGGDHHH